MINNVPTKQKGRNVETYIDDIVVKSEKVGEHVKDLEEVFSMLRKFRVKLNAKKCVFGIVVGKFLRFMALQRGIEANHEKIKTIFDM